MSTSRQAIMILRIGTVPRRIGSMMPTMNSPDRIGAVLTRYSTSAKAASADITTVSTTVATVTIRLLA